MKNDLLEHSKKSGYDHNVSNIQFVVTVPAIWSDTAKQAMTNFSVSVSYSITSNHLNSCFMRIQSEMVISTVFWSLKEIKRDGPSNETAKPRP